MRFDLLLVRDSVSGERWCECVYMTGHLFQENVSIIWRTHCCALLIKEAA